MIPSLDEIVAIGILILPGFFSMAIGISFYGFTRKIPQFDKMVWSIMLSGVIDSIFFGVNGLFEGIGKEGFGEQLRSSVLSVTGLAEILILSFLFGIAIAFILRMNLSEYASRFIHYKSKAGWRSTRPLWQRMLSGGGYVIIESNGTFYQGYIGGYSTEGEDYEVVIMDPEIVEWTNRGEPRLERYGQAILFSGKDISNIVFIGTRNEAE